MKLLDIFFCMIILIQEGLKKFENWYETKKKFLSKIYIVSVILSVVLILCEKVIIGEIVFILGTIFMGIENVIGWKNSVRRWIKVCVIYNLFFSIVSACVIQGIIKSAMVTPLFVIIYLFVWMFLTLISNSKVALLVNEIVSGIATTIFTIGTYLVSMSLKNMPSANEYQRYFNTEEAFVLALTNQDALAWEFLKIVGLETLEVIFISFLPIIGVSALCIIMIKIKGYWMDKNDIVEPEA